METYEEKEKNYNENYDENYTSDSVEEYSDSYDDEDFDSYDEDYDSYDEDYDPYSGPDYDPDSGLDDALCEDEYEREAYLDHLKCLRAEEVDHDPYALRALIDQDPNFPYGYY